MDLPAPVTPAPLREAFKESGEDTGIDDCS